MIEIGAGLKRIEPLRHSRSGARQSEQIGWPPSCQAIGRRKNRNIEFNREAAREIANVAARLVARRARKGTRQQQKGWLAAMLQGGSVWVQLVRVRKPSLARRRIVCERSFELSKTVSLAQR